MPDIIKTVEQDAEALWKKIVTLYDDTVEPVLNEFEKEVVDTFKPLVSAAEASALAALKGALVVFLGNAQKGGTLADLETAFLNELEALESNLLTLAKGLGSNLLQALIGLILAKVKA